MEIPADPSALEAFTAAGHAAAVAARGLLPAAGDHRSLLESILAVHALGNVLKAREAELLGEAERRQAWVGSGAKNMADWLAGKTKSNYGDAKKATKLGAALANNKKLKDAVDTGAVSPDTAAALADTINTPPPGADEQHLDQLVDACTGASPKDAREAADLFSTTFATETEEQASERRHQARFLRFGEANDGLVALSGLLPAAAAAQVKKSLHHAGSDDDGDARNFDQRMADGLTNLATAYAGGHTGGGRQSPQIIITMTEASFTGASNQPARSDVGIAIPALEARRLADVAALRLLVHRGNEVLALGRSQRFATDAQYAALVARDGGCIWPGCTAPMAWTEIDHIHAWESGGATDLANEGPLCGHHHREKHRPGVWVDGDAVHWRVHLADGTVLERRRPPLEPHPDQEFHPPGPVHAVA